MPMQRWNLSAAGRDNLELIEVARPDPGPNEALVRVEAVSLNYRDKLVVDGVVGGLPPDFVPGSDMAGTVVAVGRSTQRVREGDRVIAHFLPDWIDGPCLSTPRNVHRSLGGPLPGVLAEYLAIPQEWLVLAPRSLDAAAASTLPVAGLTAWFALVELGRLRAGQRVLVQGTGGVSLFGLQIGKLHGAEVIVTSSSEAKLERALALGASHAVNRNEADWVDTVLDLTDGQGVDHVLEIVGGSHLAKALEVVASGGRVSLIGLMDGFDLRASALPLITRQPVIQGIAVGHRRALEEFIRALDVSALQPVIDSHHKFDALPAAMARLDEGPFGKVVIDVA